MTMPQRLKDRAETELQSQSNTALYATSYASSFNVPQGTNTWYTSNRSLGGPEI